MTTCLILLVLINYVSSIQWYTGTISGLLHDQYAYKPYYSSVINKIILFHSTTVTLFDPYTCLLEPLNIPNSSHFYQNPNGPLTVINDKIYIDFHLEASDDKLVEFDPITYDFKFINQVTPASYSCLTSDNENKKIYIIGGINSQSAGTQIYSITDNTSYFGANLTRERRNPSCINYHNHLYVFGGYERIYSGQYDTSLEVIKFYDHPHTTIEVWDLNITNSASKSYGWQLYDRNNVRIINSAPHVLIFNDSIYLFHYDQSNSNPIIQIFDPVQGRIVNDTSSLFFNETFDDMSAPVNVNDELIYIFFGGDSFQLGAINNSVIEKLDSACFGTLFVNSTVINSTTNNPTISPTSKPSNNSSFKHSFIAIIWSVIIAILLLMVGSIVFKMRKQKKDDKGVVNDIDDDIDVEANDDIVTIKTDNITTRVTRYVTFSEGNIGASKHIATSADEFEAAPFCEEVEMEETDNQIEGVGLY